MTIKEIQIRAAGLGLKPGKMKKTELIRSIQLHEGNQACFQTRGSSCDQGDCCWRQDCLAG